MKKYEFLPRASYQWVRKSGDLTDAPFGSISTVWFELDPLPPGVVGSVTLSLRSEKMGMERVAVVFAPVELNEDGSVKTHLTFGLPLDWTLKLWEYCTERTYVHLAMRNILLRALELELPE